MNQRPESTPQPDVIARFQAAKAAAEAADRFRHTPTPDFHAEARPLGRALEDDLRRHGRVAVSTSFDPPPRQ